MLSPQNTLSPFHEGELQAQTRMGVAEKAGSFGPRLIRDHLVDQHRAFYAQLPFLLLGTVDEAGRPWASMVTGAPGFLATPDDTTLQIAANPLPGDPLNETLRDGADVGVLGIQLETRRRNRMTGRVRDRSDAHICLAVHQSFGNCPRYIQTRHVAAAAEGRTPRPVPPSHQFSGPVQDLITRADTLFIATAYAEDSENRTHGADVSHRGGKPGFVRLEDDRTFVFPDFSGNNLFNTVGNLLMNPRAGLLFPDFATGDLVYMTGTTQIIWDGPEVESFTGAERLIRFQADEVRHVEAAMPLTFSFGEYAPNLKATGDWQSAAP